MDAILEISIIFLFFKRAKHQDGVRIAISSDSKQDNFGSKYNFYFVVKSLKKLPKELKPVHSHNNWFIIIFFHILRGLWSYV